MELRPTGISAYSKTCLKPPLKKETKNWFSRLNAGQKYCRMLKRAFCNTLDLHYKQPFVFKTFTSSIFEWPLKTGFTVLLRGSNQIYLVLQGVFDDMKVLPPCIKVGLRRASEKQDCIIDLWKKDSR